MIQLDVAPDLQNIRDRIQGNNPIDAYYKGAGQAFQNAQQQNALATIARQNQARQYAPAAMRGDPNALSAMANYDPQQAMDTAKYAQVDPAALHQRAAAMLYAVKDGSDQDKINAVNNIAQLTGKPADPSELDPKNFNNLLGKFMSLPDMIAQRQGDRSYDLQKGGQALQQKTLDYQISNSNRTYNLEVGRANQNASRYSLPPIDPRTGGQISDPAPQTNAGGQSYPGGDGITSADKGGAFTPSPSGGSVVQSPNTQAQPNPPSMQPPKINGFPAVVAGKPLASKYGGTPLYPNAIVASNVNGMMSGDLPPDDQRLGTYASQTKAALAATGYDFMKANEDWQAIKKNISVQNGPKMLQQRASIDQLEESIPLARQLAQQWQQMGLSGQFPQWNKVTISAAMNGLAGPEAQKVATQLASQINHMSPELAMIYKGGSAATDAAMAKADTQLRADWSLPQLMSALDLVEQNMVYRKNSLKQAAVGAGGQPIGAQSNTQPQPATPNSGKAPVVINGYSIQEN